MTGSSVTRTVRLMFTGEHTVTLSVSLALKVAKTENINVNQGRKQLSARGYSKEIYYTEQNALENWISQAKKNEFLEINGKTYSMSQFINAEILSDSAS